MTVNVRKQFKVLDQNLHYLDSAATTLKPTYVTEFLAEHYDLYNGSPHRGAHKMSVLATEAYNQSKLTIKEFVGADVNDEVIYTKNSTESLNLLAASLQADFAVGDKIVITITSHHSNILPWQRLAKRSGAELVYLYCDQEGFISDEQLNKIDAKVKLVAFPLITNGIGTVHRAEKIIAAAKAVGAKVVLDAAQAVGHIAVDFKKLDADYLVFSGHKVYAPQGIGVLVAKHSALEDLDPFLLGGDMIEYVTEQDVTFAEIPTRFEAGTQNVGGAVALARALEWLKNIGLTEIYKHERELTAELYAMLVARPDIEVYGVKDSANRGSLVTFNVKGVHPHDVATILDSQNVAIRAGHHCCQPLMKYLQTMATCRASLGIYNNSEDIVALAKALDKVQEVFN